MQFLCSQAPKRVEPRLHPAEVVLGQVQLLIQSPILVRQLDVLHVDRVRVVLPHLLYVALEPTFQSLVNF